MKHLWILNRESGICLFEMHLNSEAQKSNPSNLDSDLFTGFVSAIFSFSRVINGSSIDMMVLQNGVLYYRVSDFLVIVILASKTAVATRVRQLMADIEREFLLDYKSALETNLGDEVAIFAAFKHKVIQLFNIPSVLTTSDRTGDLRDTLLRLMHKQISLDDAYSNILSLYDEAKGQENAQLSDAIIAVSSILKHVSVEDRLAELVSRLENEMNHWGTRAKLFVFGLDKAGKTSILNRLQGKAFAPTSPTLSVDVEQFEKGHLVFQTYDMAGQKSLRESWVQHLPSSQGLIFVIDYNDPGRFKEAMGEFSRILSRPEADLLPILIFANKKDLCGRFESAKFASLFELRRLTKNPWKVIPCSAKTGDGIEEGLKWLVDSILAISQKKREKQA